MIYTKVNLREFVDCVNAVIEESHVELPYGDIVKVLERDPEIYRGYQWGVAFVELPGGGCRPLSWGGEYGYPRDAARNLNNELMNDPRIDYMTFWNCQRFRNLVRDIES